MTEREKHCVDHCPICGAEQYDGYNDLEFFRETDGTQYIFVRFYCGECGQKYVEQFVYDGTWYETEERHGRQGA